MNIIWLPIDTFINIILNSRFLPPNSYIDASYYPGEKVAEKLAYLTKNLTAYLEYFRWQKHYKYTPTTNSICELCKAINKYQNNKNGRKSDDSFRKWWNPSFKSVCRDRSKRAIKLKNRTVPLNSETEVEVKRLYWILKTELQEKWEPKVLF